MTLRYLSALAAILIISLGRRLLSEVFGGETIPLNLEIPLFEDSESLLALGERIRLSNADLYDLELIPGLSETLAMRILERREFVLKIAAPLPNQRKWEALQFVKGVGSKTARHLHEYLSLE